MNKKYIVRLTAEERKYLEDFVSKGKRSAYKIKHANILLKADADGRMKSRNCSRCIIRRSLWYDLYATI